MASLAASEFLGNTNGETVATYIGDVPYYIDLKLYDIQRVEVLMGPQGTLYGAGTLGGAVRYIPNRPDPTKFTADVHLKAYAMSHSGDQGAEGDVVVNIPIVDDKLAIRALFGYVSDPGFVDYNYLVRTPGVSNPQPNFANPADVAANLTQKKDANNENSASARVALFGQISDAFDATLTYYYQDVKSGGRQATHRALGTGPYESAYRYLEPNRRTNQFATLELNYDFEWAKLTSASSYGRYVEDGQRDQTDLLLNFEYGYELFPSFAAFTRDVQKDERINEEIRLVSNTEGRLNWIVGGFFNHLKSRLVSNEYVPGYPEFIGVVRPDNLEYVQDATEKVEEKAAFGEVGLKLTGWWQVTGGGSYYSYTTKQDSGFATPLLDGDTTAINLITSYDAVKVDGFLYKVNTSVNLATDLLLYATLSQGYRLGGINPVPPCLNPLPPGQNVCALPNEQLIKPDKTLNKEIGFKGSLLDGRVAFSTAFFHIKWKDIQTAGTTVNGAQPITVNGGKAVSKGLELAGRGVITENWSAMASYSYTDAYLTANAPGLVDGTDAFAGDRVAGSPKHKVSFSLDYTRPLSDGYVIGASYGVTYQSNVFTKVGLRNNGEALPGFALHSASVKLSRDVWELSLYADNVFDKYAVTSVRQDRSFIRSVGLFDLRRFHEDINRPRVVGLEMRYKFGA